MERKIGEVFEYQGRRLKVIEQEGTDCCDGCVFFEKNCKSIHNFVGECDGRDRSDNKGVIFVNADEFDVQPLEAEQPQQELNLCEILKYCPEGWEFYHVVYGRVWFCCIDLYFSYPIRLSLSEEISDNTGVTSKGTINKDYNGECLLFPSKDQRDWSKFTAPWLKKERFDPKTLKPFDKVVVSNIQNNTWHIEYFSHIEERCKPYPFYCLADNFAYCIPYNDDTKHLVGTTDEAPEFYKYWED